MSFMKHKILNTRYIRSMRGFSLLELLITLAILGILMVTVTNLILINLKVARIVQGRSYAREETSFMLNLLKKDIRNAENVERVSAVIRIDGVATTIPGTLHITRLDENGNTKELYWYLAGKTVGRGEGTGAIKDGNFAPAGDVELSKFTFTISGAVASANKIVKIELSARGNGMPENQYISKVVAVSTRNYEF